MRWGVWGNMNEQYSALRSNVSMLGKVLGDTIKEYYKTWYGYDVTDDELEEMLLY